MCNRHLLGEHVEIHMLAGNIKRGKSIDGFLAGLVDPCLVIQRHEDIVNEMVHRGMNHKSPLDCPEEIASSLTAQPISGISNLDELARRCHRCSLLIKKGR